MFDGEYPDRSRCSAVEDPIVPPPPITMTLVFDRGEAMAQLVSRSLKFCGRYTGAQKQMMKIESCRRNDAMLSTLIPLTDVII